MNQSESRFRRLLNQLTAWWANTGRNSLSRRPGTTEDLRRGATARAQQARTALNDLRNSETGRKAAGALHDLRGSGAGKRAASALHDLREREPVRKAGESARRALQDLRHGADKS